MSGARLVAYFVGGLLIVVPAIAGVYNGATLLGVFMMGTALALQFVGRRD